MHNRAIIHGCLVAIDGVGVLIVGDAGVGKTTVCLELEGFGHNFIADDSVLIRRINDEIVGSPPPETAGLVASRGIGMVKHISRGAELSCSIDRIVELSTGDQKLSESRIDKMLNAVPRKRFVLNELTAKEIESFALERDRDL